MNLLNLIEDANTGYDNLRALMQAVQNSQDAVLNVGSEPITLTYPEARFMFGKYKAYNKAGRQEEFIADLGDPVKFDLHMKQLRQLLDKQKNFRGSVPGERGVTGDVPQGQLSEIGNTPAGQAALKAVGQRADDTMSAWSANPKSGYSSTPTAVAKASNASVAASNRQYGFGIDQSKTNTVMARDALRKQQAQQGMAEGSSENKYSNLSNRGVNRGISRAGDDFNRMLDLDQAESPHYKTQHQQDTKQRLKTKPMAGPKGVLPEQGVAEVQLVPQWQDDPEHLAYRKKQADISKNTGLTVGDRVTLKDRPGFEGEIVHDWGGGDFTILGGGGGMSQSKNHRANARLIQKIQGQVNELSSDLLRKYAQVAKDKSDQAMDPTVHNALGGGYMNPLAKHYDTLSQKFSGRAVQVGRKNAVKNIASPATMRKIGMAEGSFKQTPGQQQYSALHSQLQSLANSGQINTPGGKQKAEKMIDTIQQLVDTDPSCAGSTVPSKKIWLSEQGMTEPVTVEEIAMSNPERPTTETAGKINWERMIKDYMENKPYSEFEFPGDRPLTLYRSQVYAILKDFGRMKPQQKVSIILKMFGDKYAMVDYLDKLRAKGMMPKKVPAYVSPNVEPVPPGQMSFPGMASPKIKEAQAQKKNSNQAELDAGTARSPKVQRAFQLARARQAAAGSDIEAFVKDELEKSEQAQTQLDQLQAENNRQDQQIQQLAAKVRQQDQEINQVQQPTGATPAKAEPPKEKPKAAEPEKKAQPVKKAEPRAAEKSAEPTRRNEPRAEPAPAKAEKPPKVDQPKSDDTQIQRPRPEPVEVPANVLQFPTTAQRKKNKKAAAAQVDPMAAAMQGVDMIDMGRAVGMNESSEELHMGDPVIIRGNVEHSGKTGDVAGFGRDKHFVIVDLYNFGQHAFHASNIEYNNHDDYIDENQRMDKFTIAQPPPGGTNRQREAFLDARDRLFRQMQLASPGEKEAIRLKIAELEGQAQSQGIRIRESDDLNRSGYNAIKTVGDWAEKMRVMRELQKDIALMSDPEAKASVQQRIGDLLKVGIKQGYIKEALNDKAMAVLRGLKNQTQATQSTALNPAQQAEVDAWAQDFQRNVAGPMGRQIVPVPAQAPIDLNVPDTPKARRGRPSNAERAQRHQEFLDIKRRLDQLNELIRIKEQIDKLFIKAQNVRGGIYPGLRSDIEAEELYPVPETDQQFQDLLAKYTKDLAALQKFLAMKKAVYREDEDSMLGESTALVRLKQARQALSQQGLNEYAPGQGGGGSGDYFQALASAWYNGTFDSGSLQKGIKSQQDVERLLNRGIIGPDGVTRKYGIDYNSTFDGVVISSDDYYEHSDYNDQGQEVDSRNGRPWGPYDYMEFSDDDLSESVSEGNPYDLPGIDYPRPGDAPRRPRPQASTAPRRHPDDPDFMDPDQRRLRADQARVAKANAERRAKKEQGVAEGSLNELAPGAGDEGGGEDPYGRPRPKHYNRSIDFFGQFEADHFDREDFDDATGVFKGYWGNDQIAYFKFDKPQRNGSDDPGMGWYYEPQTDSRGDNINAKSTVDNADERKQQELAMIRQFLKSGNRPNPESQIGRLMKKHGMAEGEGQLDEKQDACYNKVKSRYKVWPSAYASGALVQCRKKGAANWGNKKK